MPMLSADDLDASRRMLRKGSKSFFAASLVLPGRVRRPATVLYAFCRTADDAIDTGCDRAGAVDDLRTRLDLIYRGRARNTVVDRAFATVVETHQIPRVLPDHLVDGFAWDVNRRRYHDLDDLEAYALRVAGTVGLMMALLMDRRDEATLARAADLGIAMQYTNIARDIGEDARAGRLYLPVRWMRDVGLDEEQFLANPCASLPLAQVVQRLLSIADHHYHRAAAGIARLPRGCRPAIHAARLIYSEIGDQLRTAPDPVAERTVVPKGRKVVLLARAFAEAGLPVASPAAAPAPVSAAALIRQIATTVAKEPRPAGAERLIDILTALETRRRAASSGAFGGVSD